VESTSWKVLSKEIQFPKKRKNFQRKKIFSKEFPKKERNSIVESTYRGKYILE